MYPQIATRRDAGFDHERLWFPPIHHCYVLVGLLDPLLFPVRIIGVDLQLCVVPLDDADPRAQRRVRLLKQWLGGYGMSSQQISGRSFHGMSSLS